MGTSGYVWHSWGSGGYNFAKLPYNDVTTNTNLTTARVNSPNFGRWFTPDPAGKGAISFKRSYDGSPGDWRTGVQCAWG